MGQKDKEPGRMRLSRRDFLKVSAAGAAAAGALDFAVVAPKALAYDEPVTVKTTTCPYCSASCGQKVVVGNTTGSVLDIYGDDESPLNRGGLCAKGAGAYQLVTNPRRLGYGTGTHPVNAVFAETTDTGTYPTGVAYKRTGNDPWDRIDLDTALGEIASGLVTARGVVDDANGYNSKGVAFFGSSHMNNEQNNTYRKIIANFGTSNVEHQARI